MTFCEVCLATISRLPIIISNDLMLRSLSLSVAAFCEYWTNTCALKRHQDSSGLHRVLIVEASHAERFSTKHLYSQPSPALFVRPLCSFSWLWMLGRPDPSLSVYTSYAYLGWDTIKDVWNPSKLLKAPHTQCGGNLLLKVIHYSLEITNCVTFHLK